MLSYIDGNHEFMVLVVYSQQNCTRLSVFAFMLAAQLQCNSILLRDSDLSSMIRHRPFTQARKNTTQLLRKSYFKIRLTCPHAKQN